MKNETRQEVNKLLDIAKGTPKRNDLNTSAVKDLQDAKKMNKELTAQIAIDNYKKWKKS